MILFFCNMFFVRVCVVVIDLTFVYSIINVIRHDLQSHICKQVQYTFGLLQSTHLMHVHFPMQR